MKVVPHTSSTQKNYKHRIVLGMRKIMSQHKTQKKSWIFDNLLNLLTIFTFKIIFFYAQRKDEGREKEMKYGKPFEFDQKK